MQQSNTSVFTRGHIFLICLLGGIFTMGCNGDLPNNADKRSQPEDNSGAYDTPKTSNISKEQNKFFHARKKMIETQIEARGIKDKRLLEAMLKVERHKFVPVQSRDLAYIDGPLSIGEGQTISQPYIVAIMTELLNLKGDEKVLEIGTGSGYQAAILAELSRKVFTIEIVEPLAKQSKQLFQDLGYKNIIVRHGDGYAGWKEQSPFDAIIVTCAPPYIPQPLIEQLAEGGKMVIPVGTYWQELKLIEKLNGKIKTTAIIPVRFVPMTGKRDK